MIKIKSRFKGWLPATKEQALRYARHIYSGAVALRGEYKTEYINTNYLKGVTLTEGELRGR